jgi:hypothetical protein
MLELGGLSTGRNYHQKTLKIIPKRFLPKYPSKPPRNDKNRSKTQAQKYQHIRQTLVIGKQVTPEEEKRVNIARRKIEKGKTLRRGIDNIVSAGASIFICPSLTP